MCEEKEIKSDLDGFNNSRSLIDDQSLMFGIAKNHLRKLIHYFLKASTDEKCKSVANSALAHIHFYTLMMNNEIGDSKILIKTIHQRSYFSIKNAVAELSKILEALTSIHDSYEKKLVSLSTPSSKSLPVNEKLKDWWNKQGKTYTYLPTLKEIADMIGSTAAGVSKSSFFKEIIFPQLSIKDPEGAETRYKKRNTSLVKTIALNENTIGKKTNNDLDEEEIEFKEKIEDDELFKNNLIKSVKEKIIDLKKSSSHNEATKLEEFINGGIDTRDIQKIRFLKRYFDFMNN